MVRVVLPAHLRTLSGVTGEALLQVETVTICSILDALEHAYPMLRGTIRDYDSGHRRPFVRFFACGDDWSHASVHDPLPNAIASGQEQFLIVGAIAGG